MRAWQFWKFDQKTPGFGISKDFYLTVLAATASLPPITRVIEPAGAEGAVAGFGAPLSSQARKEDLSHPMERGGYVLASLNRQTVLRLLVLSKEEAGFDLEPFLRSKEAELLTSEHLARIRATWTLMQLTFESHEAMVYESAKFVLKVAQRLAALTQGVVSDSISRVYLLPNEVFHEPQLDPKIDVRDWVQVWYRPEKNGWCYTLGLQKFAMPEFEIVGVEERDASPAKAFLLGIGQSMLLGKQPEVGGYLGAKSCPFQVATGGIDRGNWEGIPCFELLPPSGKSVHDGLAAWAAHQSGG